MLLEFPQAADLVGWHLVALYPTVNCIATHAEVGSDRINREPTVRHDECRLKSAFSYYSRLGRSKSHEITLHLCFVKFGQNVRISSHMKWKTPILGLRTGFHKPPGTIRPYSSRGVRRNVWDARQIASTIPACNCEPQLGFAIGSIEEAGRSTFGFLIR